ncbi:hypothetical protein JCM5350_008355 [Sporobolomyces pararoseus]
MNGCQSIQVSLSFDLYSFQGSSSLYYFYPLVLNCTLQDVFEPATSSRSPRIDWLEPYYSREIKRFKITKSSSSELVPSQDRLVGLHFKGYSRWITGIVEVVYGSIRRWDDSQFRVSRKSHQTRTRDNSTRFQLQHLPFNSDNST